MKYLPGLMTSLLLSVLISEVASGQDKDKDRKMREMELRLERLEKIVFATNKLSVMEAERRLTRAQQRYDNNEKLLIRGFITERQFAEDRFNLQLAFREREMARNSSNSRRIGMKIDVLRAENRLRVAKDNFERNSRQGPGRLAGHDIESRSR